MALTYTVEQVADLPQAIDLDSLIAFLKDTQSYEWAMFASKTEDPQDTLKEALLETNSKQWLTRPLSILGIDFTLAYLDDTVDSSRPMMTNYHKNRIQLYQKGERQAFYLNGLPFWTLGEANPLALLQFAQDEAGNVFCVNGKRPFLFASAEDWQKATVETFFTLCLDYIFFKEDLRLPSYSAFLALEALRGLAMVSLNKRYRYQVGRYDELRDNLHYLAQLLTGQKQARGILDTVVLITEDGEDFLFWEESFQQFETKERRLMHITSERDLAVALSRDMEIIVLPQAHLETFFYMLPSWRNKKIAYLLDEVSLGKEGAETLWQRLEHRIEKERSLVLYPEQVDKDLSLAFEG